MSNVIKWCEYSNFFFGLKFKIISRKTPIKIKRKVASRIKKLKTKNEKRKMGKSEMEKLLIMHNLNKKKWMKKKNYLK